RVDLMFEAGFPGLKGCRHMKNLPSMLDRHHAARTEARTVAAPVNLVKNGNFRISRDQKIGVQGMAGARFDRARSSDKRLAKHLSAEDSLPSVFRTDAAKNVFFDGFEVEQRDQLIDR